MLLKNFYFISLSSCHLRKELPFENQACQPRSLHFQQQIRLFKKLKPDLNLTAANATSWVNEAPEQSGARLQKKLRTALPSRSYEIPAQRHARLEYQHKRASASWLSDPARQ